MNSCRVCGEGLAEPKRGRKPSYCGSRCRVAAHRERERIERFTNRLPVAVPVAGFVPVVPVELTSLDRWVRHKDKRPMAVGGWWCSVTDSSHWSPFVDAVKSPHGDGIGFVLNGDGIVCVDLDDCVVDGVVSREASEFVDALGVTYSEFSPSGNGLHVWGFGFMDKGTRFTANGLKVEAYPAGRYITVTGDPYRPGALGVVDFERALSVVA